MYAEIGGLITYGTNLADLFGRAATYADKMPKGAKPAKPAKPAGMTAWKRPTGAGFQSIYDANAAKPALAGALKTSCRKFRP